MPNKQQQLMVVIADTHPVFLQGLENVFLAHKDIAIVAKCPDGLALMDAIRVFAPDIAMIDMSMPGLNGLEVLASIRAEGHATRVLFLTAALTSTQILDAISFGAKGILFKNSTPNEIMRGIRKVAVGRYQFPEELAGALRKRLAKCQMISQMLPQNLTPRESEATQHVIKGLTNKEIGKQMNLTEGTVKIHLHNIFKKFKISSRTALATLMVQSPN